MTPMTTKTETRNSKTYRGTLTIALLLGALTVQTSQASAVSAAVKIACMSDYFAYCSAYEVGSQELRQCMRSVGSRLSKPCVNALVSAGEVPKSEVSRRAAQAD